MKEKYTKDMFHNEITDAHSVTVSNLLIEASYNLTLNETRLFYLAARQINPTKWKQKWLFRVSSKDWEVAYKYSSNSNIYRDMKISAELLMNQKPIRILNEDKRVIDVNWLSSAEYIANEGVIELEISEKLRYYLAFIMLQDFGFTSLTMQNVGKLNSSHSIRIYEMLMQFYNPDTKSGWLKISPETIIERLQLPSSYKKNKSSIMQKVITPSLKKIDEESILDCEVEVSRNNGRSISQYSFKFKDKEN